MTLDELNRAADAQAREALLACCGSGAWAERILVSRPLRDAAALHHVAEAVWFSLTRADWLDAFSKHPKIGDKAASKWPAEEQRGMSEAGRDTAHAMRELNERYERKFGWIFIVCATGKSAGELHNVLETRLSNDAVEELQIAVIEQSKIMHLRLNKLLTE
jgi:2-oxo-4-hydroxy-4-carboxy-5-ureidoimidazoline decarboxylase